MTRLMYAACSFTKVAPSAINTIARFAWFKTFEITAFTETFLNDCHAHGIEVLQQGAIDLEFGWPTLVSWRFISQRSTEMFWSPANGGVWNSAGSAGAPLTV